MLPDDEIQELIPSVLACDVGNTNIRLAHVKGAQVGEPVRLAIGNLAGLADALAEIWATMPDPKRIVASSVNPTALKALEAAAAERPGQQVLVIGREIDLPMATELLEPARVGADRICCAVAAYDRIGDACIIADFGTAITIDCVGDNGVFLGGAILPGLSMSAASLAGRTAALPHVKLSKPDWVFGRNTEQAIVGGIVYGARGALRRFVEDYATQLGHWPLVIATGGDAELVCDDPSVADLVQAIVPDLALRGIAMAYYATLTK